MKERLCSLAVSIIMLLLSSCSSTAAPVEQTPIRIGWQTTWATQGQIVQTLHKTNVLEKNGLTGTLVGASYGGPLNEAALAGEVDVIFTADQPAATLLARDPDWVIIGRLMFNRVAIYVPPQSPIQDVKDLKGKSVAMPFGAAAQRVALKAIADAGLDPKQDIKAINLDITEQAGIIERGSAESWDEIDAMAGFDPTVAIFETSGAARMLHKGTVTSVIVMSKDFITAHANAPEQFLKAFIEAVYYYAGHQEQANEWFRQESQLTFDDEVLALAASVEPNLQAQKIDAVDILFEPTLIAGMQEAADFIYTNNLVKAQVDMAAHIDQTYAEKAKAAFAKGDYKADSVKVKATDS